MKKNFPRGKKSLLQQKMKMLHFLCYLIDVFSFSKLILCHFVHGRVLDIIDMQHYACRWFAFLVSIIDAQHCTCRWFALSVGIVNARHYKHRVVDITSLHCSN
jgi:hypothetical protein